MSDKIENKKRICELLTEMLLLNSTSSIVESEKAWNKSFAWSIGEYNSNIADRVLIILIVNTDNIHFLRYNEPGNKCTELFHIINKSLRNSLECNSLKDISVIKYILNSRLKELNEPNIEQNNDYFMLNDFKFISLKTEYTLSNFGFASKEFAICRGNYFIG